MRRLLAAATAAILLLALGGTPARADDSYGLRIPSTRFTFSPGAGAAVGDWTMLWSRGAASAYVTTTALVRDIEFAVDPQLCEGAPHLEVAVDNTTVFSQEMLGGRGYLTDDGSDYAVPGYWRPGRHKLTFRFLDDHRTASCDRNVRLRGIVMSGDTYIFTSQALLSSAVEVRPVTAGQVGAWSRPWGGLARLWNDGSLSFRLDSQRAKELGIWFTGTLCEGSTAHVRVVMDGRVLHDGLLPNSWLVSGLPRGYLELGGSIPDGVHTFTVTMSEGLRTASCNRNLVITELGFHSYANDWYPT